MIGHYACVTTAVGVRRAPPLLIVLATVVIVAGVIVWHAWPASSHRLSESAAQHACAGVVARHGGEVGVSMGESAADVRKIDAQFHAGVSAFLSSLPKSAGVAECSILVQGSDLHEGCGLIDQASILASSDGARFVPWCPAGP